MLYDTCGAVHCVYSIDIVGGKGVPIEKQKIELNCRSKEENECGNKVQVKGLCVCSKSFGTVTTLSNETKGGKSSVYDVYVTYYTPKYVVSVDDIMKCYNIGEKNLLLICRHCFDFNLVVLTSGGYNNRR